MPLLHFGRYAYHRDPVAPSALKAPISPFTPRALPEEAVEATIEDFVRAAEPARPGGYDGVEIMGSEGYRSRGWCVPCRPGSPPGAGGRSTRYCPRPADRGPARRAAGRRRVAQEWRTESARNPDTFPTSGMRENPPGDESASGAGQESL
ncbi:NADH:flavin oxidoreductase / NADH oxidase family protein [Streptomyces aidingensis]|uniref:NADH:flavin oxidoreductase / NADH oxidase family protein n=1 Tax=Streptomyces aidingensis TaxID=910347 RepID=A0A1I1QY59_9ACTN|nr:NADH:flavin oxidoreductase / NADH oxidase family protein [Streptomyces aidingensis]